MTTWYKVYEKLKPYMVRIETETGFGTGFLFGYAANHSLAAFATACHVVEDVEEWRKPIKIRHYTSGKVAYFENAERVILLDHMKDTATILVKPSAFNLPPATLPLLPSDKSKKIGVDVGWAGFPALSPYDLCFFSGSVSFYRSDYSSYLIDGVAINGVSGGPVFSGLEDSTPQIIGVISAYMANRRPGEALPGLLRAQDLTIVHEHIKTLQSLDDAKQKEDELQKKVSKESAPPVAAITVKPEPDEKDADAQPVGKKVAKKKVAKKKVTKKASPKKDTI